MKRALWMLPLPAAALAFALLSHRAPAPAEPARTVTTPETAATTSAVTGPTWAATVPGRNMPRAVVAPVAPPRNGPKPPTESRTALMESKVPAVPEMSIDHVGTPREQLLQERRGASESRQVQLDQLSDRTEAYLARLRAERAHATGEERARIDRNIAAIERNQSFRARIVTTTGHVPVRPGARAD